MSNSIRVKSDTEYVIEVNDLGETISLDPADLSLPIRAYKMFETIEALTKEYREKAKNLDEREDSEEKTLAGVQLLNELYRKSRDAVDAFLGPGAWPWRMPKNFWRQELDYYVR